jgi:L-fuconolactonase
MDGTVPTVDAHQHIWDPAVADYPWLTPDLSVLNRRFDVPDVADALIAAGIDRTVLVQAADNVEDSENMLRAARAEPRVAGVVVWLPLHDVAACEALLVRWSADRVVGVRHLIHRDPDPDWLVRGDVQPGLHLLAERGLAFDVCAESTHLLALVPAVARVHPTLRLVVDHLAKPPIRDGGWQPWADLLALAAERPNVVAKLSGLNTAAGPGWTGRTFQRYVDHALDVFGPGRLLYGGDWPFALLAADSYAQIHSALVDTLHGLAPAERSAVMGGTASRVYRLEPVREPAQEPAQDPAREEGEA